MPPTLRRMMPISLEPGLRAVLLTAALLAGIAWLAFSATQAASAETEVPLEPISGSPGIPAMVFYGLGALLVVGAIILYLLRRRR